MLAAKRGLSPQTPLSPKTRPSRLPAHRQAFCRWLRDNKPTKYSSAKKIRTPANGDIPPTSVQSIVPTGCLPHPLSAPIGRRTPRAWCRPSYGASSCRLAAEATQPGCRAAAAMRRLSSRSTQYKQKSPPGHEPGGQKKTPSRFEQQGGLQQSLAAAYFPT